MRGGVVGLPAVDGAVTAVQLFAGTRRSPVESMDGIEEDLWLTAPSDND